MGSFEVQVPFDQIRARIEKAKSDVQVKQSEVVEALGVQALSLAQKDYRTLSRGGTASDGRRWKTLSPKTVARKLARGRGNRAQANRIAKAKKSLSLIEKHQAKFGSLTAGLEASSRRLMRTIGEATVLSQSTAIGIDTGLQMASGSPGFHGPDGHGGNIFAAGLKSVTIGYGRIYSKYFDIARKLLPEVLPESWRQALDRVVQAWLQKITAGIRSK